MSGYDPLAAATAGTAGVDPIAAELAVLKADAQALQTMVSSGDVVTGRVLPYNGLTDLLMIMGKRVAASLPPTVRPGETLLLEVEGFTDDRLIVRNLGVVPPGSPAGGTTADGTPAGGTPEAGTPAAALAAEVTQRGLATLAGVLDDLEPALPPAPGNPGPPPASGASAGAAADDDPAAELLLPPPVPPGPGSLGAASPSTGPPQGAPGTPSPAPGAPAPALSPPPSGTPGAPPPPRPGAPASPAPAGRPAISAAPPRSVFVQAAVQQAIQPSGSSSGSPGAPSAGARVTISRPPAAIQTDGSIEARLIAARATVSRPAPPSPPPGARPQAKPSGSAGTGAAAPRAPGPAGPPARTPIANPGPPPRPGSAPAAARAPSAALPRTPAWIGRAAGAVPDDSAEVTEAPPTAGRTAASYSEPTVLLRSLRLPVTPTNVAAAKLALDSPQRLPVALAALERALPLGSGDPRVNTLRTLAAFIADLDPESPTFPAQLSAYVAHVVDGPEPKLASLLSAYAQSTADEDDAAAQAQPPGGTPSGTGAPAQGSPANGQTGQTATAGQPAAAPGAPSAAQSSAAQPAGQGPSGQGASPGSSAPETQTVGTQIDVLAGDDPANAARIVERSAALDYDLKTLLQSFVAHPPANAGPAAVAAAQSALAALTATQVNAALAQTDPHAITLMLPVRFGGNGDPAKIKISREKPHSRDPLDADNFHIAFILDTKNVGTVAIDLQTVGRAVNVAVKSETPRYAAAFRSLLTELGNRLTTLRYNVVALDSDVVSRAGATVSTVAHSPGPVDDGRKANLDMQA